MNEMKLFNYTNWGLTKVIRDIKNYRDWIKIIKIQSNNPKSKYNIYKLQRTFLYDVYVAISLEEQEQNIPEDAKRVLVLERISNINLYLDEELGFAECLVPEFNQVYTDDGKPTLTYVIVYRFSFNKLSFKWFIKWLFITGLLVTGALIYALS